MRRTLLVVAVVTLLSAVAVLVIVFTAPHDPTTSHPTAKPHPVATHHRRASVAPKPKPAAPVVIVEQLPAPRSTQPSHAPHRQRHHAKAKPTASPSPTPSPSHCVAGIICLAGVA